MNLFKIFFVIFILLIIFIYPLQGLNAGNRAKFSIIRDTEIETILHSWSKPIFEAANLDPKSVNIILVQSNDINAFVAGGANIFIYTGLISKTENPGELISVIAHEVGHIAGGHLIRGRKALERASYESIISTILGIGVAIVSGDPAAASAISLGGSSIAGRRYLAHSRIQESSADQAALKFLEKAQLNPSGMISFMNKLNSDNYMPQTKQSEYVQTHPLASNRIEAISGNVSSSKYNSKPYSNLWIRQHKIMKAKLAGFISPGQISWLYDSRDKSIPALYARAIAAYRLDKVDEALERISELINIEPKNPYFYELKGQMLVDFNRVDEAIIYYKKAIDILPDADLFRIALAHALIEFAKENDINLLNQAIEQLQISLRSESKSPRVYRLLAIAYGRLGEDNRAKIYLAEEALLQRNFSYAKEHAEYVLNNEVEETMLWIKAKDIISFVENNKK